MAMKAIVTSTGIPMIAVAMDNPKEETRTILKKFRTLLSEEFKVLIAGGFGNLKSKVFRIGSMGEVTRYHVMRTISSIYSAMKMLGIDANEKALSIAEEKLQNL